MKTIKSNIENTMIVKRSKFITELIKIYSEEDFISILTTIKNKYKDANHYCYAYIINNTKRFNDDGEPSGTAGVPILNILEHNQLNYVLCVVIRYFGGIKLGTGGLVRTYTKSAAEALKTVDLVCLTDGYSIKIKFSYENNNYVDQLLINQIITNKIFDDFITYFLDISVYDYEDIIILLERSCIEIIVIGSIMIKKTNYFIIVSFCFSNSSLTLACAAANLAIGTRYGEQET